jgi:serine/threonine protein kinase
MEPRLLGRVGHYEILREVGRGGAGVVYVARQTDLDRDVALKELLPFHVANPAQSQRFLRESRVAGSLNHPNVVSVYEYLEQDGVPYIAMEYLGRGSLRPYVRNLTCAQAVGVLEGLLAGLAQAESRGIVHRDLKPENLLLTSDGTVKIADFGIAKALDRLSEGHDLTVTGTTVGTPAYMAPEQALGRRVGPWTDLYSVGVMAYEMLVGRVPFEGTDTPLAILLRHVNDPVPPPREVNPRLDPGFAEWIEALLVKDPARRTRRASQAWEALEEITIAVLGPRWRRDARLTGPSTTDPSPLAPAPFPEDEGGEGLHSTREARVAGDLTLEPSEPAEGRRSGPPPRLEATPPEPVPAAQLPVTRQEPDPPAAVPAPRGSSAPARVARRPSAAVRLLSAAFVASAAAGGFAVARAGDAEFRPAANNTVSTRALRVSHSDYWRAAERRRAPLPGLKLSDPLVLVPAAAQTSGELTAGFTQATGPHLLPSSFLARLEAPPARDDRVRLGRLTAQRYVGLRVRGSDSPVTVYAVPTNRGVATLTCTGSAQGLRAECERVAGRLSLLSARAFGLDPDPRYARRLASVMEALNATRTPVRERLARARLAPSQQDAAVALARANERARRRLLAQRAVSPAVRDAHDALVAALGATATAYNRMAEASARGDRSSFDRSALGVERGESGIDRALEGFEDLGWAIA